MNTYIILIVILIVVPIAIYCLRRNNMLQTWIKEVNHILPVLEIISVLILIISVIITLTLYSVEQQKQKEQLFQERFSRLSILKEELIVNMEICYEFLTESDSISVNSHQTYPVPVRRYCTSIIENALARGDIQSPEIRERLWLLYRLMQSANSMLDSAESSRNLQLSNVLDDYSAYSTVKSDINNAIQNVWDCSRRIESLIKPSILYLKGSYRFQHDKKEELGMSTYEIVLGVASALSALAAWFALFIALRAVRLPKVKLECSIIDPESPTYRNLGEENQLLIEKIITIENKGKHETYLYVDLWSRYTLVQPPKIDTILEHRDFFQTVGPDNYGRYLNVYTPCLPPQGCVTIRLLCVAEQVLSSDDRQLLQSITVQSARKKHKVNDNTKLNFYESYKLKYRHGESPTKH
ncbi:MAG: hypothetical protein KAR40_14700 [Candidatus Sabulitectum sp.]|nr:hypothetical protein [Candidatus Sabulitectum sp.]